MPHVPKPTPSLIKRGPKIDKFIVDQESIASTNKLIVEQDSMYAILISHIVPHTVGGKKAAPLVFTRQYFPMVIGPFFR